MKDRNGKELQVGDVCVVFRNPDIEVPLEEINNGQIVEIIGLNGHPAWPIECKRQMYLTTYRNPQELEIIGSVRDE